MRSLIAFTILLATLLAARPSIAQSPSAADRERARIQNRLGWESMRVEAWEAAAKHFRQSIEIDRTYEYGYYSLGRAYLAQRKYDDAIASLSKCADLYRAQAGRQFSNAQEAQRYRRERVTEVTEYIRQLQSGRQTMQVQNQIRQLQNQMVDLQESLQRGNNLTLERSVPAYVSLSLGSAYFRAGRLTDAEREYKATTMADPKSGEAFNNLAVVFLETGRYAEAEEAVKNAKKAGFRVHPDLERDIKDRKKSGS